MGTILYVDDDRSLCQIVAKALRGEGYWVRTAFDGDEAIRCVEEEPPDLLMVDLILPRRDGFALLSELRGRGGVLSQTPALLLTGCSPTPEYRDRAEALGAAVLLTKPVPLEKLLDVVRQQIGDSKRDVPLADVGVARRRKAGGLCGSLDRVSLPALFHHLHGLRASGVLHLTSGKKRKWIQLRDGYPIAVRSNMVRECLGNRLVRTGRISKADFEESRRRMRCGKLQGEILVAMELLSEEDLVSALREQAEEKLFEVFTWTSGSFRFEMSGSLSRANALTLEGSPANLILRGVREHVPIAQIDGFLGANRHLHAVAGESPFYRFQEIDLDLGDQALLHSLDGNRKLVAFLESEEPQRRTLFGLIATGLVELRGPGAPGPVVQAKRESPEAEGPRRAPAPEADRSPRPAGLADPPSRAVPVEDPPSADPVRAPSPIRPEEERLRAELASTAEDFQRRNLFEVLGVSEQASDGQIRSAWEHLSSRTHPDRFSGASDAVRCLSEEVHGHVERAFEILSDPRRRAAYVLDRKKDEREERSRQAAQRALEAEGEFHRGDAALKLRNYEDALRCFGRALELYPDEGEYHAHYGWALHLCHPEDPAMIGEAMEHVKRGLKLASSREKPYLFMGRLCKAVGRVGAAERMFSRAVQIQPKCAEALSELRLINMRRSKNGRGIIGRLFRR